jgi:hypothetical protein
MDRSAILPTEAGEGNANPAPNQPEFRHDLFLFQRLGTLPKQRRTGKQRKHRPSRRSLAVPKWSSPVPEPPTGSTRRMRPQRIRRLPSFSLRIWFSVRRYSMMSCCWRLLQPARMASRSSQGWRTKFMADPMRLRRQASLRAWKTGCQAPERADGRGAARPVWLSALRQAHPRRRIQDHLEASGGPGGASGRKSWGDGTSGLTPPPPVPPDACGRKAGWSWLGAEVVLDSGSPALLMMIALEALKLIDVMTIGTEEGTAVTSVPEGHAPQRLRS